MIRFCPVVWLMMMMSVDALTVNHHELPIEFDPPILSNNAHLDWSATIPYLDHTWVDSPEFAVDSQFEALLQSVDPPFEPDTLFLPSQYHGYYAQPLATDGFDIPDHDIRVRLGTHICQDRLTLQLVFRYQGVDGSFAFDDTDRDGDLMTLMFHYHYVSWRLVSSSSDRQQLAWEPKGGRLRSIQVIRQERTNAGDQELMNNNNLLETVIGNLFGDNVALSVLIIDIIGDEMEWTFSRQSSVIDSVYLDNLSVLLNDPVLFEDATFSDHKVRVSVDVGSGTPPVVRASPPLSLLHVMIPTMTRTIIQAMASQFLLQTPVASAYGGPLQLLEQQTSEPDDWIQCSSVILPTTTTMPGGARHLSTDMSDWSLACESFGSSGTYVHKNTKRCGDQWTVVWTFFRNTPPLLPVNDVCVLGKPYASFTIQLYDTLSQLRDLDRVTQIHDRTNTARLTFTVLNLPDVSQGEAFPVELTLPSSAPTTHTLFTTSDPVIIQCYLPFSDAARTKYLRINLPLAVGSSWLSFMGTHFVTTSLLFDNSYRSWRGVQDVLATDLSGDYELVCPSDPQSQALLSPFLASRDTGAFPHPVLVEILDFGQDRTGPGQIPRSLSDLSPCSTIMDSTQDLGQTRVTLEGTLSDHLRDQARHGHWIGPHHKSQVMFEPSSLNQAVLPTSLKGRLLVNGLTILAWNTNDDSFLIDIEPRLLSTDFGHGVVHDRHYLHLRFSAPLTTFLQCTLPWTDTLGLPISALQVVPPVLASLSSESETIYRFFPTFIGLEPSGSLGRPGYMRSHTVQQVLTVGALMWVAQQSTLPMDFFVRVVSAIPIHGGTGMGCPTDDLARVHLQLEFLTLFPDTAGANDIVGILNAYDFVPTVVYGEEGTYNGNCYGFPRPVNDPDQLDHFQSLDNWERRSLRHSGTEDDQTLLPGQVSCQQQESLNTVTCDQAGSPWCLDEIGGCFQQVVLTTKCMPTGEFLASRQAGICPATVFQGETVEDPLGQLLMDVSVWTCDSRAAWEVEVDRNFFARLIPNSAGTCFRLKGSQSIRIGLLDFYLPPPTTSSITLNIEIESRLLPVETIVDFDNGVDTEPASSAGEPLLLESSGPLAVVVRPSQVIYRSILPVAIASVVICKGRQTDIIVWLASATATDMQAFLDGTTTTCFGHAALVMVNNGVVPVLPSCQNSGTCLYNNLGPRNLQDAADPPIGNPFSSFPLCQSVGEYGCDGLALKVTAIQAEMGNLEDDEVFLALIQTFLGPIQTGTGGSRRLLSASTPTNIQSTLSSQIFAVESAFVPSHNQNDDDQPAHWEPRDQAQHLSSGVVEQRMYLIYIFVAILASIVLEGV